MTIKTQASRVDITRHSAHIDEKELLALIADAVAKAAGLSLDCEAVSIASCFIASNDSSTGPRNYAKVEIIVDHTKLPRAG